MHNIVFLGKDDETIQVATRISLKAKRISIRITPKNEVELILTRKSDFNKAHQFLLAKELWIRNKIRTKPLDNDIKKISILGVEHELITNDSSINQPILIQDNKIIISRVIAEDKIDNIITFHLKKLAKIEIEKYAELNAKILGVKYQRITIKDTSSRWGSCSSSGNLSFSWRLILAPKAIMEYVVIHELCHLIEMNHSPRFWKLVEKLCPEYRQCVYWLKKHGKLLHLPL